MTGEHAAPYARLVRPLRPSRARVAAAVAVLLTGVVLLSTLAVIAIGLLAGPAAAAGDFADPVFTVLMMLSVPASYLPVAALTARYVLGVRPGAVCSVLGRFRWRWYGVCLAVATVWAAGVFLVTAGSGAPTPRWPVVACTVVSVLVFTLLHLPRSLPLAVAVASGALTYAVLTHLTGGIEAASAAHAAWNMSAMTAAGVLTGGAGTLSAGQLVGVVAAEAVLAALIVVLARRRSVVTRCYREAASADIERHSSQGTVQS